MTLTSFILGSLSFCVVTIMLSWSWDSLRAKGFAKAPTRRAGVDSHDNCAWWETADPWTESPTRRGPRSFAATSQPASRHDVFAR